MQHLIPKGKRVLRQGKDLLFGDKSHELLVFLFFLAVSFGFWMLQALNETFEHEVQVGLQLTDIPSDVVLIDSLPTTVSVTVRDRGLTLARHDISNIFRQSCADVSFQKFDTGGDDAEIAIFPYDMQRFLSKLFAPSTHIQSFRPDTLHFTYNRGRSRMLPVRTTGTVQASQQNYVQSIGLEPDSVRVFAPASVLDTMHAVYTEPFSMSELSAATRQHVRLRRQRLMKYDPDGVDVVVGIGYYTEKTVHVPVIGLNFPAEKRLRAFPAQVSVTFRVESGRYRQTTAEDFVLVTTYEDLLQNPENSKLPLNLKSIPEGVYDVRISPAEVDYLIEQVDAPY